MYSRGKTKRVRSSVLRAKTKKVRSLRKPEQLYLHEQALLRELRVLQDLSGVERPAQSLLSER